MRFFDLNQIYVFSSDEKRSAFSRKSETNKCFSKKVGSSPFIVTYISDEGRVLQIKDQKTKKVIPFDNAIFLLDENDKEYFKKIV